MVRTELPFMLQLLLALSTCAFQDCLLRTYSILFLVLSYFQLLNLMQFTVVKLIDYLVILMLILIVGCLLLVDSMYKQ